MLLNNDDRCQTMNDCEGSFTAAANKAKNGKIFICSLNFNQDYKIFKIFS